MRIMITGGKGMLGRTLQRRLSAHELFIADLPDVDICDLDGFAAVCDRFRPDAVIHCAAMTRVDDCETNDSLAFRLNGRGSFNVSFVCGQIGARLIAISTDYVFSGDRALGEEWSETDKPEPRTIYGKSKLAGEIAAATCLPSATILRIAWLYGAGGPSFVHTMAKLVMQHGAPLKVVNDQQGNPTSADVVADEVLFLLAHPEITGVVHGTCSGNCTWYELTVELFRLLGITRQVTPCTTAEFPRPAPRPANSALANTVLESHGYLAPRWQDALASFVQSEFRK